MKYLILLISFNLFACPQNLGHRVGGDIGDLEENTLETAKAVKPLENHACFTCWEFDINRAKGGLVVFHDTKYKGKKVKRVHLSKLGAPRLGEFVDGMPALNPVKPLCFDVKEIKESDFTYVLAQAEKVSKKVPVRFLISHKRKSKYGKLMQLISSKGFPIGHY